MREKTIILLLLFLAIFMRVTGNVVRENIFFKKPLLLSGTAYDESIICDETWYDSAARGYLEGGGVVSVEKDRINLIGFPDWLHLKKIDENRYAHKLVMPLYPLFLSACYYAGGIKTISYFIPQVILGALTCIFVYLLARDIFDRKVALTASLAAALYPDLIFWTRITRVETLFIFLLTAGFWFILRGNIRQKPILIHAGGALLALASLTRITFIFFIPILFLWQLCFFKRDKKRSFKVGLMMIIIIVMIMMPWCVRNFLLFNKFTPLTDEINIVIMGGDGRDAAKNLENRFYYEEYSSPIVRTLAYIKDHHKEYLRSFLSRLIVYLSPCTPQMKPLAKVYKSLTWVIIFPLAFFGIAASLKAWEKIGLLTIFVFYYSFIHAGSFVDSGLVYRYPIQPFLCIFAAQGFWVIYHAIKLRSIRRDKD